MDQLSPRSSNPGSLKVDTLIGGTSLRNLTHRKLICCPSMSVPDSLQDPRHTLTSESLGSLTLQNLSIAEERVYYLPVLRQDEISSCFMVTANPANQPQRIDESSPGYFSLLVTLDEAERNQNIRFSLFLFHSTAKWMSERPSSYRGLRNVILLGLPATSDDEMNSFDRRDTPLVCSHFVYYPSIGFE